VAALRKKIEQAKCVIGTENFSKTQNPWIQINDKHPEVGILGQGCGKSEHAIRGFTPLKSIDQEKSLGGSIGAQAE
jgi:hypothetical protein